MNDTWCELRSATVSMAVLFLSACGTTGETSRTTVTLENIPPSSELRQTNVASVESDFDGIRLVNVGVQPWGKFDANDMANLEGSLNDTLKAVTKGHLSADQGMISVHLVIRKYIVATSNNAGAVWAGVDWCVADRDNRILFQETFYATSSARLIGTVGGVKDAVNRAIVKRIAQSTIALAANSRPGAVKVSGTYSTFEEAAATMPQTLYSPPYCHTYRTWFLEFLETCDPPKPPEPFPFELALMKAPIDWQKRLASIR
jgi:hypothetical protein